jgi:hypothetical protein
MYLVVWDCPQAYVDRAFVIQIYHMLEHYFEIFRVLSFGNLICSGSNLQI